MGAVLLVVRQYTCRDALLIPSESDSVVHDLFARILHPVEATLPAHQTPNSYAAVEN